MTRNTLLRLALLLFIALPLQNALASPILVAIAESTHTGHNTRWPNTALSQHDLWWADALRSQGTNVVDIRQKPTRLSPTVYPPSTLSANNARSLASLFGAQAALTGEVQWQCRTEQQRTHCRAQANLQLVPKQGAIVDLSRSTHASAPNIEQAKIRAITLMAADLAIAMLATTTQDDIPNLFPNPVLVLDPLPNADALVSLRRILRRIPGVEDIAERWISATSLALEINPGIPSTPDTIFAYIDALLAMPAENMIIRETKRTQRGVAVEIVNF